MLAALAAIAAVAPFGPEFAPSIDHPALEYSTRPTTDVVARLNADVRAGARQLDWDAARGYLPATLEALGVPPESQVLVFSKTSLQERRIGPDRPRALYFSDQAAVAWVQRGALLEVAASDPSQGVVFYGLAQRPAAVPQFTRREICLECHVSDQTLGVPGFASGSLRVEADGTPAASPQSVSVDHRTPLADRWGGWYVSGDVGGAAHRGVPLAADAPAPFAREAYLRPTSDPVALLVLGHQSHLTNLLTRAGWELRVAEYEAVRAAAGFSGLAPPRADAVRRIADEAAVEIVDYLLFVDEAPLPAPVTGDSGFARTFEAGGPRDRRGRSLRELDLHDRLLRYPCSYMVYSPAFAALPPAGAAAVRQRLRTVLEGRGGPRYLRLSAADRQAVLEILTETLRGFGGPG